MRNLLSGILALISSIFVATLAHADPLYDALLRAVPQNVPHGFSSPAVSEIPLADIDRSNGITGIIQIIFAGDLNVKINYLFFPSADDAKKYSTMLEQRAFAGRNRKFLVYLPDAGCVDIEKGGVCDMQVDRVLAVTFAAKVDGGASLLMKMAVDNLRSINRSVPAENQPPIGQPIAQSGTGGPCALVTKNDAATALGGPVGEARRDSANSCMYGSASNPGDSVTIQLMEGGLEKFNFDQSHVTRTTPLSGIGDYAFAFISPAGFVQVSFVKGTQYIALTVMKQRDPRILDAAKTLAMKIAGEVR